MLVLMSAAVSFFYIGLLCGSVFFLGTWLCWVGKFTYYREACLCVGINFIICDKSPIDSTVYIVYVMDLQFM